MSGLDIESLRLTDEEYFIPEKDRSHLSYRLGTRGVVKAQLAKALWLLVREFDHNGIPEAASYLQIALEQANIERPTKV